MATKPIPKENGEQGEEQLDAFLEEGEIVDYSPSKLSDQLIEAYEDEDTNLTVTRKMKGGRKTAFLFEIDEYEDLPSLQVKLRDEYGGGEFFIEGRKRGRWVLKQELNIEPPLQVEKPIEKNNDSGDRITELMLMMQENARKDAQQTRDLMVTMQDNARQAQLDAAKSQNEMLVKMMEINSNNKSDAMGPLDMITMVTSISEMNNKGDPTETLLRGLELGKELAGNNGADESILTTALKTIGKPLTEMASKAAAVSQVTMPQEPTKPKLPNENNAQNAAPKNVEMETDEMKFLKFKPVLEMLIKAATNNADHALYAELAIDQLDDDIIERFILIEENYLQLYQMIPQTAPLKPWLDICRDHVIGYMAEDNQAPEPPDNVHEITGDHSPEPIPNETGTDGQHIPTDISGETIEHDPIDGEFTSED